MANGLALKITQNNRAAINLVKSLLSTPLLINVDISQGAPYAVALDCESYQTAGQAEVSESLVICKTNKVNIADNVAPGSMSWNLQGYILGIKALEPTNYFTPFVRLNTDILWQWFKRGAILKFKDGDSKYHDKVVIQSFTTSQQKDCRNATPFTMTLKEINVVEDSLLATVTKAIETATPIAGAAIGATATVGATIATVVNAENITELTA